MECSDYILAYEKILEGYLRTGDETFLLQSYDLGKRLLKSRLSTEFAADMHFRSLERVRTKMTSEEFTNSGHNPAIPFLELTMAFGLAFRDQLGAILRFTEIIETGKRQWEKTFDAISHVMSLHDSEGLVIRANKAFCDFYGRTFNDIAGQSPWRLFYSSDAPAKGCLLAECLAYSANEVNLRPISRETYIPELGRYFAVSITPVGDGATTPLFFLRVMRDVTQRKKREQEKKKISQEIRKAITLAEEREHRRIAQDIHDNLGQTMAIARNKIQELRNNLTTDSGTSGTELKEIVNLLDQMISQTRTLTFDLYPPMLDDLGLIPTIEWYTDDFASKTGLKIHLIKTGKQQTLSKSASTYLFRAVKEILNNIFKHAKAHEVILAIHGTESTLRIVIDDDGKGFSVEEGVKMSKGYTGGIGLVSIRQGVSDMDGQFFVESTPGQGTRVVIEVPIT